MYFIYLIECDDESIYTGITTDVQRRFKEHKNKKGGQLHPFEAGCESSIYRKI